VGEEEVEEGVEEVVVLAQILTLAVPPGHAMENVPGTQPT